MNRSLCFAAALAVAGSAASAAARAQDNLGALTLYGPDGRDKHSLTIQSFFFQLQPPLPPGTPAPVPAVSEEHDAQGLTVTAQAGAPDAAIITWLLGPDRKRHVVLHIQDNPDGAGTGSTFDLQGARLTGLTVGYAGGGNGNQTLTISADHLTINGLAAY